MKKRNFWVGVAYTLVGVGCLLTVLLTDTPLEALFSGFAGGTLSSGLVQIYKYFYWMRPEKREEYAQRLENERIAMGDERNRMLRDSAGRAAFMVGIYAVLISIVVFCVMDAFHVPAGWSTITLYLAGFLALEFTAYVIAFKKLEKKH